MSAKHGKGIYIPSGSPQGALGYRPVTLDASHYSPGNSRYHSGKKRGKHTVRNVVIVVLAVIIVLAAALGIAGFNLYNSAMKVKEDASVVMSDISELKDQVMNNEGDAARATARNIEKTAASMKEETSGGLWNAATLIPVYGSDIKKVQELSNMLDNLAKNGVTPLIDGIAGIELSNLLLDDGTINVAMLQSVTSAIEDAAPVVAQSVETLDKMGDANLEQINGPLQKARDSLGKLNHYTQFAANLAPTVSSVFGADGKPRSYLVLAQSNAEIRATGGFPGSIGTITLDNGHVSMGSFETVYNIYPPDGTTYVSLTDEEVENFGWHVAYQVADTPSIPDFPRVASMIKTDWESSGRGGVAGVVAVDPSFLQHMLALAGPVTTSSGVEVNGDNAASVLLNEVYYLDSELQDPFFEEVAALAFQQLLTHLGSVDMKTLMKQVMDDMEAHHFQMWMADSKEQAAVTELGADGSISSDETAPVVGAYINDEGFCKLYWYLKIESQIGDAIKHEDGTKTYPVSVTYRNMLQPGEAAVIPSYMANHNGSIPRSEGDMCAFLMLSAPMGGVIDNVQLSGAGELVPPEKYTYRTDGAYYDGTFRKSTLYNHDFWYGLFRFLPEESVTLNFNVTVPATATEDLKIVTTPTAQDEAGWQ